MKNKNKSLTERVGRNSIRVWKMIVSLQEYKNILKETQKELKDFNMNFLTNWEQNILFSKGIKNV